MSTYSAFKRASLGLVIATCLAASSLANRSSAAQQAPETAGLRLGMTHAEARARLAQIEPDMQIQEFRASAPGIPSFVFALVGRHLPNGGSLKDSIENIFIMFSPVPGEDKVLSIERNVSFQPPQNPPVDDIVSSLRSKLGPWSNGDPQDDTLVWAYAPSGNTIKLPTDLRSAPLKPPCVYTGLALIAQNYNTTGAPQPGWSSRVLQDVQDNEGCSKVVRTTYSRGPNPAIAETLSLGLVDVAETIRSTRRAAVISQQSSSQQQEQEIQKAHQNSSGIRY